MAKVKSSAAGKKKISIVKLKIVAKKLQKSLLLGRKSNSSYIEQAHEEVCDSTSVPEDVKEGHFAVIAVEGEEPKRFIVPLTCLSHPTFLRLLEQAAEEYGFDHEGALTVPCKPGELERILGEQWQEGDDSSTGAGVNWDACKAMVQSN